MSKVKLNQFDELRARFQAKREAKKPFSAVGHLAAKEKRKKPAKPTKDPRFFDVNKYENWLAPARKTETT